VSISRIPDPDLPFALQVELTNRCNLRCRMCPLTSGTSSSASSRGAPPDRVLDDVLSVARRCQIVILAGFGEALLDPRCLPFLRSLDAAGVKVRMATNGHPVTARVARELAALEHLVQVNVSIDSSDPATYREVRGGRVERALEGVAHLAEAFTDRERLTVSAVVMQSTVTTLVGLPAALAQRGARRLQLQGVVDFNDYGRSSRLLDSPDLVEHIGHVERACEQHGVRFEMGMAERTALDGHDSGEARRRFYGTGTWDPKTTRRCTVPWEIPFVDRDGVVFPCCNAAAASSRPVGRIGEQSLETIWLGESIRRFRRELLDGSTTPEICRACTIVPLGEHPLVAWSGSIAPGGVEVSNGASPKATVRVRNEGARTWRRDDFVRIGTASPRDWPSEVSHPGWLSPNRAATFAEEQVAPGEVATFTFPVLAPAGRTAVGDIQIVVDGVCWLPGTRATLTVHGPRRTPAAVAAAAIRLSQRCGWARPVRSLLPPSVRARIQALAASDAATRPSCRDGGRRRPEGRRAARLAPPSSATTSSAS
jgi:radical SAM protein with 4Fe4S-binding SPASM domain